MGHADDDFRNALRPRQLDRETEQRDKAFRAFKRETLRADELLSDEFLENHGVGQACQNPQLLGAAEIGAIGTAFHALLKPVPHEQIVDVHELHTDRPAIRVSQPLDDFAQSQRSVASHAFA